MRILGVIDSFTFGGAETQLAAMLSFLAHERGHECIACSILPEPPQHVEFGSRVRRIYLDKRSRLSLPRVTRDLHSLIRDIDPSVVYSRLPMANALSRLATSRTRKPVRHVAGVDTVPAMYTAAYTLAHPGSLLFRYVERFADCLVFNSEATRSAAIETGYPSRRLRVVPNGIVDRFRPAARRSESARPQLLCVASLRPEKGVERLIRVLAPLLQRSEVALRIVGDGSERPAIERAIARLDVGHAVELLGAQRDVLPALHAADVFVGAAMAEGFGIAVAEAAATGLPAVVFAVPGGLGEVIVDGTTGFLIPDGDEAQFRKAVDQLTTDAPLRTRMGLAARRHVVEHFSLAHIADMLEAIFTAP